jgi:hypothetical protein
MTSAKAAAGLLIVVLLLTVACGASDGLSTIEIEARDGSTARLRVEIAATRAERTRGLANRDALASDRGMLFLISERGPGFWNKDVAFPLSVAFVSRCGVIVDIQHMAAGSLAVHDTPAPFRFGLEVNQGWFERNSIGVGSRLQLPLAMLREAECPE